MGTPYPGLTRRDHRGGIGGLDDGDAAAVEKLIIGRAPGTDQRAAAHTGPPAVAAKVLSDSRPSDVAFSVSAYLPGTGTFIGLPFGRSNRTRRFELRRRTHPTHGA